MLLECTTQQLLEKKAEQRGRSASPLTRDGDRWDPVAPSAIEAALRGLAVEIGDGA